MTAWKPSCKIFLCCSENAVTDLVNIAQYSLLNTFMLDDFSQNPSVTTSNDQNLLRVGVRVHGQVCNHLLVCKLVTLGALDDMVEDEDGAVVGGFKDQDVLVLGLLVVDDILDFQGHGLARPHIRDLAEPAIWIEVLC
jgi:hypothetical protein